MTPEQERDRQSNYSKEVIAPLCEKIDQFIRSQNISQEDFVLIIIQMCGAHFPLESMMSQMLFRAWCVNEQIYHDKKVRESN